MEHASASQVGYEGVKSLTELPSEPQVDRVEAEVPETAASPDKQSAVRDSSKTVWTVVTHGARMHEWAEVTRRHLA